MHVSVIKDTWGVSPLFSTCACRKIKRNFVDSTNFLRSENKRKRRISDLVALQMRIFKIYASFKQY